MADPLTVVGPTKSLYDMLTSRHGLTAFAVAGMQTAMFLVVVWVGGWDFARDWGTVAMWIVFLMCSVVLLIAWAYHVYRDAEDRRDRASTEALHRLSQEVLSARREAFASDEGLYKARKEWSHERDEIAGGRETATREALSLRENVRVLQAERSAAVNHPAAQHETSLARDAKHAVEVVLIEFGQTVDGRFDLRLGVFNRLCTSPVVVLDWCAWPIVTGGPFAASDVKRDSKPTRVEALGAGEDFTCHVVCPPAAWRAVQAAIEKSGGFLHIGFLGRITVQGPWGEATVDLDQCPKWSMVGRLQTHTFWVPASQAEQPARSAATPTP